MQSVCGVFARCHSPRVWSAEFTPAFINRYPANGFRGHLGLRLCRISNAKRRSRIRCWRFDISVPGCIGAAWRVLVVVYRVPRPHVSESWSHRASFNHRNNRPGWDDNWAPHLLINKCL
ncbi:uncharacterized protein CC84DRAFT_983054 [Paraphaeosphaeria sporulosa]|uniref:Uncharacterized protein n=1 Tax=Paraphaeosphaeria sporulosa TaxID=1460663 RepID=A0A177C5D7_9PLEO|nr:uncharacterized protein CC84DRAFT_983054 [Paraphaeosphaeria sporulosa]OAG02102.1 hypothetical protein CC84DRAFT_983054 [Paraphaeosphaeria sporulosa]